MANSISNIVERLTEYIQIKIEQVKLKIIEYVARLLSSTISVVFIVVLSLFFVFFLSFSIGSLLNERMNSPFLGHLIIAGFYFLLIVILFLLLKTRKIQTWMENWLMNIAKKEDEPED